MLLSKHWASKHVGMGWKIKQNKASTSDPDVKKYCKNFAKKLLLSPSIKHQTILHLYEENTTFPNY